MNDGSDLRGLFFWKMDPSFEMPFYTQPVLDLLVGDMDYRLSDLWLDNQNQNEPHFVAGSEYYLDYRESEAIEDLADYMTGHLVLFYQ